MKRCFDGSSSFGEAVGRLVGGCSPSASCIFHISKVCPKWGLHFILCLFAVLNFVDLCLKPEVAFCWLLVRVWISLPRCGHLFFQFIFWRKTKWLQVTFAETWNLTVSLIIFLIACVHLFALFSLWYIASAEEIIFFFIYFFLPWWNI